MLRNNLMNITKALRKHSPEAKMDLILCYIQHKWLDDTEEDPVESQLVKLAWEKIEKNPREFERFISMLRNIKGMKSIVKKLTGELSYNYTSVKTFSLKC